MFRIDNEPVQHNYKRVAASIFLFLFFFIYSFTSNGEVDEGNMAELVHVSMSRNGVIYALNPL